MIYVTFYFSGKWTLSLTNAPQHQKALASKTSGQPGSTILLLTIIHVVFQIFDAPAWALSQWPGPASPATLFISFEVQIAIYVIDTTLYEWTQEDVCQK